MKTLDSTRTAGTSPQIGDEFSPNDTCPKSGIYKVSHIPAHAPDHEVTCFKGRKFPRCRTCGHPRFVLVKFAPRIDRHEFFRDQS